MTERRHGSPGRLLTGRMLRNTLRLGGCTIVRQSEHHVLMEYGDRRVTVPMLKGPVPQTTLHGIASTLEASGGKQKVWRHLHT